MSLTCPELKAFVEKTGTGLVVDEKDASSVAKGMKAILSRPEAYKAGSNLATDYSWQAQEQKLQSLYEDLTL